MKASTMFGLLEMLSSQAIALKLDGTYLVESRGTQLYLTAESGQVSFAQDPQAWFFIESETDRYAIVNNDTNQYINCGLTWGALCRTSDVAQLFQIDNISDNVYTFLASGSEWLLHCTEDNKLDLRFTNDDDVKFALTQA
ncbi:hypothetical protein BDV33DRAFT_108372 [Aspergillus novoparasiticus]|uniref:Ricin B lectin domain-containing protein n=1 Tax=Aspergillus novoparasiticus TaxID=986946 RepID=A0A5N6ERE1_9EURO|nr:hypothetical protein BDV33DRAFT_108372 [Aspergillus novoparasiticus]